MRDRRDCPDYDLTIKLPERDLEPDLEGTHEGTHVVRSDVDVAQRDTLDLQILAAEHGYNSEENENGVSSPTDRDTLLRWVRQ